jgi:nitrite reductase (cytochrome c-552)
MPYMNDGGIKYSDHHIQSPLAQIDRTCQFCHRESEGCCVIMFTDRQRKVVEARNILEKELAKAHIEAKFAWEKALTKHIWKRF